MKKYLYAFVDNGVFAALHTAVRPQDSYISSDEEADAVRRLLDEGYRFKEERDGAVLLEKEVDALPREVVHALNSGEDELSKFKRMLEEREATALRIAKLIHGDKAPKRYPLIDCEADVSNLMRHYESLRKCIQVALEHSSGLGWRSDHVSELCRTTLNQTKDIR